MKIILLQVGKTEEEYLRKGTAFYENRIAHYTRFESVIIPGLKKAKNLPVDHLKKHEAELIIKNIPDRSTVVLLDDKGIQFTSQGFAQYLQHKMNASTKNIVFIIGGPYGFDKKIYDIADEKLSLSTMTFSHQMVRLIFIEQLYRAFTILRNESYHH